MEEIQPKRSLSRSPLFQVKFILENALVPDLSLPGMDLTLLDVDPESARFDLVLSMREEKDALTGTLIYRTDLFDRDFIAGMLRHYEMILEQMAEDPKQRLSNIRLMTETETEGYAPCDFPYAELSQRDFENLILEIR